MVTGCSVIEELVDVLDCRLPLVGDHDPARVHLVALRRSLMPMPRLLAILNDA
jgi:hypothetical protein